MCYRLLFSPYLSGRITWESFEHMSLDDVDLLNLLLDSWEDAQPKPKK